MEEVKQLETANAKKQAKVRRDGLQGP